MWIRSRHTDDSKLVGPIVLPSTRAISSGRSPKRGFTAYFLNFPITSALLWPPKPSEFDIATSTVTFRFSLGT